MSQETAGDPEQRTRVMRAYADRFRAERVLKCGMGVTTFAGVDLERGVDVVIKEVAAGDMTRAAMLRLEHEAHVLQTLDSPHLGSFVHLGRQDDVTFVVRDMIPGVTLAERLLRGPIPVRRALGLARCLLDALCVAHEGGVVHLDVKPANVIVSHDESHATLIDFGLSRSELLDSSVREMTAGTVRYMSPEQAGLLSAPVDERSDLYSAGLVLFEMLSGRAAFQGETVNELFRQQLSAEPTSLRALGVCEVRAVDELVLRLLRKEPRERYQDASAVVLDLELIAAALDRGQPYPPMIIGRSDHRARLTEPAFIGRRRELAKLSECLDHAMSGRGSVAVIEGVSGIGKSRVLLDIVNQARGRGLRVLHGKVTDREAMQPFSLLMPVVDEVVAEAREDPSMAASMRERLGGHGPMVGTLFPQLARLLGTRAQAGVGQEIHAESRATLAVSELLSVLGDPERPVVVALDDCQWSDELTLRGLARWNAEREGGHATVLAAYRSDEVGASFPLRGMTNAQRIELGPMDDEQIMHLLASMSSQLPDEAVQVIVEQASGNPFMATALLWGLVEHGALTDEGGHWKLDARALTDVQSSRRAAVLLARRLKQLPAPILEVLRAAALMGRSFDAVELGLLVQVSSERVLGMLREARKRQIVLAEGRGGAWRFVHDKLRESLLSDLEPEHKRTLHRRRAEQLLAGGGSEFEVAYQYDAAGHSEHAWPFAMKAGDGARHRHALDVAEQQYRIAARGMTGRSTAEQIRTREALGDVLTLRDRHDEATEHLTVARSLTGRDVDEARIMSKLAFVKFRQGKGNQSTELAFEALRMLGQRVPGKRALPYAALEVGIRLASPLIDAVRVAPAGQDASVSARDAIVLKLLEILSFELMLNRGMVAGVWAHFRRVNLASRYPESLALALAFAEHAPVLAASAMPARGARYAGSAVETCARQGEVWGLGHALHHKGLALYMGSQFSEALGSLREAVPLLRRAGDSWDEMTAFGHVGLCQYRLGNLREASEALWSVYLTSVQHDFGLSRCGALQGYALATCGRIPKEPILADLRHPDRTFQYGMVAQAEAIRCLRAGEAAQAADVLERAWLRCRQEGLHYEHILSIPGWIATSLRVEAMQLPSRASTQHRRLLDRARRAARKAVWIGRFHRNHLPHALREQGILDAMDGHGTTAKQRLDESLRVSERQKARYERAQTLLARGELGSALGWAGASDDLVGARAELLDLGADMANGRLSEVCSQRVERPVTPSIVDRFDVVLRAGRDISVSLTRQDVFAATRRSALDLLRGERCAIIEQLGDGRLSQAAPPLVGASDYSGTLVRRALETGEPQVAEPGLAGEVADADSLLLSGARSAIAVPIVHRGDLDACLYVTHRQVGGLFGEEEKRIASFVATLAGAALDNAWSYGQLQSAFDQLERSHRELKDTQAQLVQAGKLAALGQLGAGIAHELNQPLQAIRGFAMRLKRRAVDQDAPDADELGIIVEATGRMARLIDNVRLFARNDPLSLAPTDLLGAMDDALLLIGRELAHRGIEISWVGRPEHAVQVSADRAKLQQVFLNLLLNAGDALSELPAGQPRRVELRVERKQDRVTVVVADNGKGVPEQLENSIFEPFFTTKDAGRGTGLGLAIAYGIVQAHRGDLQYRRARPNGAEFALTLSRLA